MGEVLVNAVRANLLFEDASENKANQLICNVTKLPWAPLVLSAFMLTDSTHPFFQNVSVPCKVSFGKL
jgi:hypothetical protein